MPPFTFTPSYALIASLPSFFYSTESLSTKHCKPTPPYLYFLALPLFFLSFPLFLFFLFRLRRADQRWQQRKLRLLWGSPRYISGRGHWLVSRFLHLPLWHYESFWNARGWRNWGGSGGCWWRVTDWRGSGPKDMCYFRPSQSIVVFSTAIVTEAFYLRRTCSFDNLIFS